MKGQRHIEMIATVARGLRDLKDEVVFVGGATVGLHITDPAAPEVRLSEDVDCVVEIATRSQYYDLEQKLRRLGFKEPREEDHPLCRWVYSGVTVDIMPTNEKILGFSNKWYLAGIQHAQKIKLPNGPEIAIFSSPYLMASKIDAFNDRGHNDFLGSADMEDIVSLVDGCERLPDEIKGAALDVKDYLKKELRTLLKNDRFVEAVRAHIDSIEPSGGRTERALAILNTLARSDF